MKQPARHDRTAVILFTLTIVLFFSFFVYMSTCETVSVFQLEQTHSYTTLTDFERTVQSDETAPVGMVKIYQGILDPDLANESCLCFNIAHHNIEVYFDDVLVYRLTGSESNRIGKNVSSNWCSVHVGQEHGGQSVTVVLTPLFEAGISKEPIFLLGSHYAISMHLLSQELSPLIFSSLCMLLGIFVVAVSIYFNFILKSGNGGTIYLGFFSIALGLWKIMDLQSMPMMFPQHAMSFGYISVGALFLTGLMLLMYFRTLFMKGQQGFLLVLSIGGSLVCLYALTMQVLGITEIRQNLVYSHGLLIIAITSIPLGALFNRIMYKTWGIHHSWRLLTLLFVGIGLDLLLFYLNNSTGLMSFSIVSFIIYTSVVFLKSVQESTRKAYTDSRTGLDNRTRWNELMNSDATPSEPYAILVVDLNGLKQVNDTLGHEAGDQMIYALSSILRNTLPRNSVICRWGGDEFTVLLNGVTRAKLDQHIDSLTAAGEAYNVDYPNLPIHFAVGAALSAEHPDISRTELFRLADEDMYRNKQLWYAQKQTTT